jgi:hypothetical protein
MLKNDGFGLLAVAWGATFIHARHGQPSRRFHNIHAMRIVALDAVHFALGDRVVLRQMEFPFCVRMALETGCGILAGVDDEFGATAPLGHMLAAGSVARLAPGLAEPLPTGQMQTGMRAGWKGAGDAFVATCAGPVADKRDAFNLQGNHDDATRRGTRLHEDSKYGGARRECERRQTPEVFRVGRKIEEATAAAGFGKYDMDIRYKCWWQELVDQGFGRRTTS